MIDVFLHIRHFVLNNCWYQSFHISSNKHTPSVVNQSHGIRLLIKFEQILSQSRHFVPWICLSYVNNLYNRMTTSFNSNIRHQTLHLSFDARWQRILKIWMVIEITTMEQGNDHLRIHTMQPFWDQNSHVQVRNVINTIFRWRFEL